MASVARSRPEHQIRARILTQRPYHPWHLMPLAEYLVAVGYSDATRSRIVDAIEDGAFLTSLVTDGTLGLSDLAGAESALEAGRKWRAARTLTAEPFMPDDGEPDPFDETLELDVELDAADADAAARLDRRLAGLDDEIEAMRKWYSAQPSFSEWLDREGGPA